jgi:zinc protease
LGGSASGRLNRSLRVERGLTYGAFATIRPKKGPSAYFSTTSTRTEKTAEALKLMVDVTEKLAGAEVPPDELQNAKSFIIGSFPLTIEIPNDLATRLTTVFLYDLGDDYLKTFRDRLAAVSAGQVLRVAKEKIATPNTAAVLVGKANDFKQQLAEFGKVEIIPAAELDLDSPALRKK